MQVADRLIAAAAACGRHSTWPWTARSAVGRISWSGYVPTVGTQRARGACESSVSRAGRRGGGLAIKLLIAIQRATLRAPLRIGISTVPLSRPRLRATRATGHRQRLRASLHRLSLGMRGGPRIGMPLLRQVPLQTPIHHPGGQGRGGTRNSRAASGLAGSKVDEPRQLAINKPTEISNAHVCDCKLPALGLRLRASFALRPWATAHPLTNLG